MSKSPARATAHPAPPEIIGPYSPWPRQARRRRNVPATLASAMVSASVLVPCIGTITF